MADTLVRLDEILARMSSLGDVLTDTAATIEDATKRLDESVKEIESIAEEIEQEIIPRVEGTEADNYALEHDDDDPEPEEGGE